MKECQVMQSEYQTVIKVSMNNYGLNNILSRMNFSEQVFGHPAYKGSDIIKKCIKYPQFKNEFDNIEQVYLNELNLAIYACLDVEEEYKVFEPIKKDSLYVNFFAYKMPTEESESQKFYMLWIKTLDDLLRQYFGKKYIIVYYHCLSDSLYPYTFLKSIYKKLPLFYHAMLQKIYVVESTFMLRNASGLFDFGRIHKLFMRKVQFVDSVYQLSKISQIAKNGIMESLPQLLKLELQQKSEKNEKIKKKAVQQLQTSRQSSINTFNLAIKKDFFTVDLNVHKLGPDGIPIPLSILFQTLKSNPKYLQMEGIFRKSGSIQEEEAIIAELSTMNAITVLANIDQFSGFAVAGVVKKFFTKLTIPIVPYHIYINLLDQISKNVIKNQDEVVFAQTFLDSLPKLNKKIILHLLLFLKESVISKQDLNKMNNYNMSVCFCPCIFRAETPSLQDLLYAGKFAGVINLILTRFEEIEGKPDRGSKGSRGSRGNRKSKS